MSQWPTKQQIARGYLNVLFYIIVLVSLWGVVSVLFESIGVANGIVVTMFLALTIWALIEGD